MTQPDHTPAGEYPTHAPLHHLDLNEAADRLIGRLEGHAGHSRESQNLAREAGVSVVMMALAAGDTLMEHAADGVVTVHLLKGRATVTASGETTVLAPGQLVLMQPGLRHDLHAEEQSVVLLTVTGGASRG